MNDKHQKGLQHELRVSMYFVEQGWEVYWPLLTQSRSDFIITKDDEVCAIQVKTAHWVRTGEYNYLQVRLRDFQPRMTTKLIVVHEEQMWHVPACWWKINGSVYFNGKMNHAGYDSNEWLIEWEPT